MNEGEFIVFKNNDNRVKKLPIARSKAVTVIVLPFYIGSFVIALVSSVFEKSSRKTF